MTRKNSNDEKTTNMQYRHNATLKGLKVKVKKLRTKNKLNMYSYCSLKEQ